MMNEGIKPQNKKGGIGNVQDYLNTQIPVKENFSNAYSSPVLTMIEQATLTKKTPNVNIDVLAGKNSVTYPTKNGGSFTLSLLNNIKGLREMRTTTHQLLDIMLMATCAKIQNGITPEIEMSLTEFMYYRNLKDRKHASRQLKKDLDVLYSASISYMPDVNPNAEQPIKPFANVRIIESESAANGSFKFRVATTFYEKVLSTCSIIPMPIKLFAVNSQKAPTAYYIGLKFTQAKYMNAGTPRADKLSTQSIMRCLPNIPSMDEVKQKDRNYIKHIIEPIETGLNELVSCGTFKEWFYVDGKGERYESLMNFQIFKDLFVQVDWGNYPSDTDSYKRRIAKKTNKDAPSKPKKPRTKKAKAEN